jgi:hypothetical protein
MFLNLLLGMAIMLATVVVHAGAMILLTRRAHQLGPGHPGTRWDEIGQVAAAVLVLFIATLVEVALWAATYIATGAIDTFEAALYFSMVTFTTLGYGDITLHEDWRLLSAVQAANGVIIFGWTTALVIAVIQRMYQRQNPG